MVPPADPPPVATFADVTAYADLKPRLERAAGRVAPPWLRDQLDDLVQMALVKLMRSGKVDEEDVLNESYLHRVMHSVVVDEIRRVKRRKETSIEHHANDPVERSVRCDPEKMVDGQEIGTVIVECLGLLLPDRRRAVTLYLQGHTVGQAAERLDFSYKKAENLVYRGLADLRGHLRKRGFQP